MKKYFAIVFLSCLTFSYVASAANIYTPYIGADFIYNDTHGKGFKPNYFGGTFNIGTSYNSYFGTELFYEQVSSDAKKYIATKKIKSSYRAYGIDLMGYIPFGCDKRFNLLLTSGIGEYVFNQKLTDEKHHNNSAFGYRFGGGALYHLNNHVSVRALIRYIHFDKISNIDHALTYSLGLRYHFTKE